MGTGVSDTHHATSEDVHVSLLFVTIRLVGQAIQLQHGLGCAKRRTHEASSIRIEAAFLLYPTIQVRTCFLDCQRVMAIHEKGSRDITKPRVSYKSVVHFPLAGQRRAKSGLLDLLADRTRGGKYGAGALNFQKLFLPVQMAGHALEYVLNLLRQSIWRGVN